MKYMTFYKWLEAQHPDVYQEYYLKYREFVLNMKRQRARDYQRSLMKDAKRGRKQAN